MSTAKENENNGRYPYHSKHKIKKEKSSKGKNVSLKERYFFRGKGHEHFKEENTSKVCCPSYLTWIRMALWCNIRNFPKSSLELKKKKKFPKTKGYGEKETQ